MLQLGEKPVSIPLQEPSTRKCTCNVTHHALCPLPEGTLAGPCPWPCLGRGDAGSQPRCPSGTELTASSADPWMSGTGRSCGRMPGPPHGSYGVSPDPGLTSTCLHPQSLQQLMRMHPTVGIPAVSSDVTQALSSQRCQQHQSSKAAKIQLKFQPHF